MANGTINNAFLTNVNLPLGTEFDDGIRNGPVLDRTITTSSGLQPYSYTQWGQGILNSANNTYNIIPRGPSGAGNVVVAAAVASAGNLTLAQDTYVTTLAISGSSSPSNLSQYIQIDWPRALSVTVSANNITSALPITVFGQDYYGVPLQESVTVNAIGTYQMKKAFYQINRIFCNGTSNTGVIGIQTTDVMGLPFRVKSAGDINAIRWGNFSDLSNNSPVIPSSPLAGTTEAMTDGVVMVTGITAVTKNSNIQVTRNTLGIAAGNLSVPLESITNNASFVIDSDEDTETSTINWLITNPPFATGFATFVGGVVVIASTAVKANSNIQLTMQTFTTAHGQWRVTNITPGVSFTVTSNANTEASSFYWAIMPDNFVSGVSANMQAGTVFVPTNAVQSNSKILLTYKTLGGTNGVLSVPDAGITPGVGFTITSSSNTDISTVNWTIVQNIPGLTQGTATLNGTTNVVIPTTAVIAPVGDVSGSAILLTYNTLNTPSTYVRVVTITNGASFTIVGQAAGDVSTVNWAIFPANQILPSFLTTLGTFTPADDTPATNTTGDVRGTYLPSTPANGTNVLHFSTFVSGFDNFVNQQSDGNLPSGGTVAVPLTRSNIGIADQVGVQQFYTGIHA